MSPADDPRAALRPAADGVRLRVRLTPKASRDAIGSFERLRHWHAGDDALRAGFVAGSVDDATIRDVIREAPARHGYIPCPHTATALKLLQDLRAGGDTRDWAVVATAHPAKFESVVEPLVGHAVEPPPLLAEGLARPAHAEPMAADYAALRRILVAG